ncbi:hypothetical protein BJ944DRAFT_176680 [Cunninghamella echinulata]|nr:hypothetical protein BJ944DRAFT_176680 [Cunninghamella echinulata]
MANTNQQYNNDTQYQHQHQHQQQYGHGRGSGGGGRGGRGGGRGNYSGGGKGRFTREFIDEDIDMGREIPANAPVIMVSGHPPGSQNDLLDFLHRKSKIDWEELNVQNEGSVTYITVDSQETAEVLLRKNKFSFMGSTLSIGMADGNRNPIAMRINNNNNSNNQPRSSNVLAEFLQERWDPQQGFLNLDDLPPTSHSITVVLSRLLNEAHKIYGNSVVTLSFARNKLWSVQPISKISNFFPNVKNLSLQENDISEFKGLDRLANNKLRQLSELVLHGNPIQINTNPDVYIKEITQRFPTLTQLDFQPIGQPSLNPSITSAPGFGGTSGGVSTLPLPIKPNFFDQDNSRQASQDLLSKFFPLFDSNRLALADLYDQQAVFSINTSTSCFARNTWGQGPRLTIGNEAISKKFASFPPTIHDLSRADNFAMDAWQVSGSSTHPVLLYLTVHGSFQEANGALSFDRVFIIAPSTPGSRAQNAGWQYLIICDSLILRNFSGNQAFQPTA